MELLLYYRLNPMGILSQVKELYERQPYPPVHWLTPLFHRVRRDDLPLLNYQALYGASFGSCEGAAHRPRILVAGCGTLEPVAVALANPHAEIVAVDISSAALRRLQWMARVKGVAGRIFTVEADLCHLPRELGHFDYVIATGVLHHLEDPAAGLLALAERAGTQAIFRLMIYSRWGRDLLYGLKELAHELDASTPKGLRRLVDSLPPDHPYRLYFHLYSDTETDAGLSDGFLHPCDKPFEALALEKLLHGAGLEASVFLHGPGGQPDAGLLSDLPAGMGPWQRLAVLELLGELEQNFIFVARKKEAFFGRTADAWEWNQSLPRRGKLRSRILEKTLAVNKGLPTHQLSTAERAELIKAMFLVPVEKQNEC